MVVVPAATVGRQRYPPAVRRHLFVKDIPVPKPMAGRVHKLRSCAGRTPTEHMPPEGEPPARKSDRATARHRDGPETSRAATFRSWDLEDPAAMRCALIKLVVVAIIPWRPALRRATALRTLRRSRRLTQSRRMTRRVRSSWKGSSLRKASQAFSMRSMTLCGAAPCAGRTASRSRSAPNSSFCSFESSVQPSV